MSVHSHARTGLASRIRWHRRLAVTGDGALLVLNVIRISQWRGYKGALRRHVDEWGYEVCEHLIIRRRHPGDLPIQIPEFAGEGQYFACGITFGSCTFCLTDYSVDIDWRGAKKRCGIVVRVYRGLGDCRSPFTWEWRSMSDLYAGEELRSARGMEHGPGCVREMWDAC